MVRSSLALGLALASNCLSTNPNWDEAADEGSTGVAGSTSIEPDPSTSTTPVETSSAASSSTTISTTAPGTTGTAGDDTSLGTSTGDPLPDGRITDGLSVVYAFEFEKAGLVRDGSRIDPPLDLTISPMSTTVWVEDGLRVDDDSTLTAGRVPASRFGTQAFTIELWVESLSAVAGLEDGPRIVAFEDHAGGFSNFHVAGGSGVIGLNVLVDESGGTEQFLIDVDRGLRHVVFTVSEAGEVRGYESGELEVIGQVPEGAPQLWQDSLPFVVANASDDGHPWVGTLGLIAIYERALSEAEVVHNWQEGR
jgi:hypothetical protein